MATSKGAWGQRYSKGRKVKLNQLPASIRMQATGEFIQDTGSVFRTTSWTADTTYALAAYGSTTSAILVPKITIEAYVASATSNLPMTVAIVKGDSTYTTTNIADQEICEKLRAEGRLFYHAWHFMPAVVATSANRPPMMSWTFKNVRLEKDEYLHVLIRPRETVTSQGLKWLCAKWSSTDL